MDKIENIKNRFIKPILPYVIIFLLVTANMCYLLPYYGILATNEESSRYMLSASVQSEAAIIAIVVTLSLVAVQLTSSYSRRVTESFSKNPHLWILMV